MLTSRGPSIVTIEASPSSEAFDIGMSCCFHKTRKIRPEISVALVERSLSKSAYINSDGKLFRTFLISENCAAAVLYLHSIAEGDVCCQTLPLARLVQRAKHLRGTRRRRRNSASVQRHPILLSLSLARYDHWLATIVSQFQVGATGQAICVLRHTAEDAEADAADETNIDHPSMTEAGRSKIYIDASRQHKVDTR